jgi:hypothetical protein
LGSNLEQVSVPSGSAYHQDFSSYSATGILNNAWDESTDSSFTHTQQSACDDADWTAIMWYKSNDSTDTTTLDTIWTWNSNDKSARIGVVNDKISVGVYGGTAGNTWNQQNSVASLGDNQWHQVAIVNDGSTQTYEMFIDGQFDHSGTSDNYWMSNNCFKLDQVASNTSSNNGYYLDEFSYHSSKLTQAEIQASWVKPKYTTHIDGMIDEYFINSDVLTTSEISKIDRRGETASPVTTSTSFNDNTVVAGNEYFYKVYSVTPDGYGTASNIDGAMTVSPANAPTGLSASVNSNAHIVLDWTPSTDLGNGSLISMNIQRDDGSGWQTIATTSNTSPPYTDTTVVTSTTYDYRVASVNEAGVGAYSNTVTATAGIPADAITNVVATIPDPNNQPHDVEISFSEPANWGTGTAQTYDIYESLTGTGGWTLVASPSYQSGQFTTTVTISNVQPATEYFYKVLAVSNHGVSNDSNVDSVITADVPSQPDPAIIGIDDPDNAPLDITVNFVDPFDGGSAIKGWMIERHDSTTNVWSTIVANTANTNLVYHDTSVLAGTDYKYRVSAINPIGTSIASLESNVVTTPTVPSAPLSLTATTIDDASIELNWSQPTSNGGSVIQTFSIQNDASGTFTQIGTVGVGVTTFTHTGLSDGTNYNYQVVAVNNVGTSVPSNQASAWTLPSAPVNLIANTISSGDTLELEWEVQSTKSLDGSNQLGYLTNSIICNCMFWCSLYCSGYWIIIRY